MSAGCIESSLARSSATFCLCTSDFHQLVLGHFLPSNEALDEAVAPQSSWTSRKVAFEILEVFFSG